MYPITVARNSPIGSSSLDWASAAHGNDECRQQRSQRGNVSPAQDPGSMLLEDLRCHYKTRWRVAEIN